LGSKFVSDVIQVAASNFVNAAIAARNDSLWPLAEGLLSGVMSAFMPYVGESASM
jgi:hypothetical protein